MRNKPKATVPRPRGRRLFRLSSPRTLDRRGGIRAGTLAAAEGVDPRRLPELAALCAPSVRTLSFVGLPTGMAFLDGRLYITALDGERALLHCFRDGELRASVEYTPHGDGDALRHIMQFNLYTDPSDPLGGEYQHMGISYPDGIMFPLGTDTPTIERLEDHYGVPIPHLSCACVHLSRVFGAAGDRLYASAYNDPQNWNIDTATDTGAANAWSSTVQSNTEASGNFRAVAVYGGEVLAFKDGFCHVLSGAKNPFRVGDLFAVGSSCPRSIAEAGGKLFFADRAQVYRYNGDALTPIGDGLCVRDFSGAVGCAGDGMYYLFVPAVGELFAYAVETGAWSSLGAVCRGADVRFMARAEGGPLLLDSEGRLYTFSGTGERLFSCTFAPITEDGDRTMRLCRLVLSLSGKAGDGVRATFSDLSGRECVLLDETLPSDGFFRPVSRMFTPADRGGYLSLFGRGEVTVQQIELMTETQQ